MEVELISVIICVRNSQQWLQECLNSIVGQTYDGFIEVSIFNDGSSDGSVDIIDEWLRNQCCKPNSKITLKIDTNHDCDQPKGVGFAKNRAVQQSTGRYLCFFDSDDIMHSQRIEKQYLLCKDNPNAIVGSKVCRIPADSTPRYINWANNLSPFQLHNQIYTCFGPTVLMPTWFCTREVYDKVGQFDESCSKGVPEDLIFFYRHLELGGRVVRVDDVLLTYRYHKNATTFSVTDETIWKTRLAHLEAKVLIGWERFSIWNAGKEGRRFYRSLSKENRKKVVAFCDVDPKKLQKKYYTYEECPDEDVRKPKVPIIHYSELTPPVVICVKLGLSNGNFERNLESLNLKESIDYVHFG